MHPLLFPYNNQFNDGDDIHILFTFYLMFYFFFMILIWFYYPFFKTNILNMFINLYQINFN